jgi:hypothetical protein
VSAGFCNERLLLKGKDKKMELIAVANKLCRKIFAIVKNKGSMCLYIISKKMYCILTQYIARISQNDAAISMLNC